MIPRAQDGPPPPRARDLALAALGDRAGNVTAHLRRLLAEQPVSSEEAALARELAVGVVRRRRTLDVILSAFQRRRDAPAAGKVRDVLRVGAYQIVFLRRVPDFAAVNEAVEQVSPRRSGMRGFVNAVLRNLARSISPAESGPPPLAPDVVALGRASFRRFDRPIFPSPEQAPAEFLAAAFSLPDELAEKWLVRFGGLDGAVPVALHANARPPLVLRVNLARASVPDVSARLLEAGVEAIAHDNGLSVVITGHADLRSLKAFADGLVQPQDAAATAVVAAANVRPGMRVLDLCAGPGTKTTHLAERMRNTGEIVAADVSERKLSQIEDNCRRMGATIVRTLLAGRIAPLAERPFDLVLVDAPCSNTGVLARRPEARWRVTGKSIRRLARDQRRLLALGCHLVRPGGELVYATCSLEEEENEQVVRGLSGRNGVFRLVKQRRIRPAGAERPGRWSDGGYFAMLRRS